MGFSGGGGGQLLNHEHDGTLVADGGPLDFKNITQSSMSAGSLCFSDGAHLQEREIGAATNVLTVAGGVPTWATPAANLDRLEQLASYQTVDATTNSVVLTFPSLDLHDYACLYLTFSGVAVGALDIEVKMGAAVSSYRYSYDQSDTGTWTNVNAVSGTEWKLADMDVGTYFQGQCFLFSRISSEGTEAYGMLGNVFCTAGSFSNSIAGGATGSATSDITTVTIQTSTSYFEQYCRFNLMGFRSS